MSDNTMPTEREVADPEKIAKARERGIRLGFKDEFLDHFIETELRMMQKWEYKRRVSEIQKAVARSNRRMR